MSVEQVIMDTGQLYMKYMLYTFLVIKIEHKVYRGKNFWKCVVVGEGYYFSGNMEVLVVIFSHI